MAKLILILAAVMLISLACSTVSCASPTITVTPTPTPESTPRPTAIPTPTPLSEVQEDAVREIYDSSGRAKNPDRGIQSISKANAGGFGGFYFDDNDPTIAYVYMLDITETTAAETAFRAAYSKDSESTRIVPVQADHSLDELVNWLYDGVEALHAAGIETSSAGMRILENRFDLAVTNESQLGDAYAVLDGMGVPRGAYNLGSGKWRALGDRDNVQSKWRPVVGGVRVYTPFGNCCPS